MRRESLNPDMSAPKMVRERDAVLRERAAVVRTVEHMFRLMRAITCRHIEQIDGRGIEEVWFPLPKVTRARILRDIEKFGSVEFTVRNGEIVERQIGQADWKFPRGWAVNSVVVSAWADLLANPTEECEE